VAFHALSKHVVRTLSGQHGQLSADKIAQGGHHLQMALPCGFQGVFAVGISFAITISKALLTHPTENRHEIRNPDAQQPVRRLRCDLRVDLGFHAGLSFGSRSMLHPGMPGASLFAR
jgi:hypothetical protein